MAVTPYRPLGLSKAAGHKAGQVVWNIDPFMKELEDALQRGLDSVGRKVEYTARFNVPVDTGLLYSTLSYYRSKYKSPTGVGSIVYAGGKGKGWLKSRYRSRRPGGSDAYYAKWVELGHRAFTRASGGAKYVSAIGKRGQALKRKKRQGGWTSSRVPAQRYLGSALDQWSPSLVTMATQLGLKVVGGRV